MLFIRQGATHKVVLGPAVAVANGYVPVTTLTLSGADEAEAILHDNGTVVDISGYTWAAITTADGYYHLTLQSGISNTVGHVTVVVNDDSLILPLRQDFTVLEEAVYDALFAASATGALPVSAGGIAAAAFAAGAIDAAAIANGAIDAATFAAGAITATVIATDAIDADAIATDAVTEINANVLAAISGIGTAGGAAINVDAATDNAAGGITGVTSGTTKVGTQTGTYTNTSNVNAVYHQIDHAGNAIDWVYQFLTGGGTSVVDARWIGYVDGSNDTVTFYAWNHVGGAWEALGTQAGQPGTTNVTKSLTLYARHRGTSAAELGKVYVRIACTGQTSPVLYTDQLYVSYAVTSRSVGYANGAVWVDTTGGVAGTESFVNGVADNTVLTLADALTIATAVGLRNFEVASGSTITLAATTINKVFNGHEWTLALGGQDISSSVFIDAEVSGTGTGTLAEFDTCSIGTATIGPSFFWECSFSGTLTIGAAGDYFFYNCHSAVAGTGTPVVDLATAGANNLSFRRWSGGLTLNNISSNDVISIDVVSGGTITLNGADGNVQVRGMCSSIVDNRTGSPTLGKNAVVNQTLLATPTNITAGTITTTTNLTNLPAVTSNWLTAAGLATDAVTEIQSGLSTLDAAGVRTAVGLASANLDTQLDALPTAAENATAILAAGDVDGYTLEETLKLCLAALAGKLSGAATTTVTIRSADDSANRLVATVDADGNRSAVTLDAAG